MAQHGSTIAPKWPMKKTLSRSHLTARVSKNTFFNKKKLQNRALNTRDMFFYTRTVLDCRRWRKWFLLLAEWEFYGGASFTFSGAWVPRTGHVVDGASGRSGHGNIFRCWGVRFKIIPKYFWAIGGISRKLGGSFAEGKGWFERAIPIQLYSNTCGAYPETIRKANTYCKPKHTKTKKNDAETVAAEVTEQNYAKSTSRKFRGSTSWEHVFAEARTWIQNSVRRIDGARDLVCCKLTAMEWLRPS